MEKLAEWFPLITGLAGSAVTAIGLWFGWRKDRNTSDATLAKAYMGAQSAINAEFLALSEWQTTLRKDLEKKLDAQAKKFAEELEAERLDCALKLSERDEQIKRLNEALGDLVEKVSTLEETTDPEHRR